MKLKDMIIILNFLITFNLVIGKSISNNITEVEEKEITTENDTEKYEPKFTLKFFFVIMPIFFNLV